MLDNNLIPMISEILAFIGIGGIIGGIITYFFGGYFTHHFELRSLERTHRQRIVEDLTSKFHEYNINYYMPLVSSSRGLAYHIKKVSQSDFNEDELRDAFYYLALFLSLRSYMYSKIHAIFLKDLSSEEVIIIILDKKILDFLKESASLSKSDLSKLAKETDPNETFIDFSVKLDNQLSTTFKKFNNWINEKRNHFSEFCDYLNCFSSLLLYEANEPYGAWYGEKAIHFPPDDDLKTLKKIIEELLEMKMINPLDAKSIQKKYKLREII